MSEWRTTVQNVSSKTIFIDYFNWRLFTSKNFWLVPCIWNLDPSLHLTSQNLILSNKTIWGVYWQTFCLWLGIRGIVDGCEYGVEWSCRNGSSSGNSWVSLATNSPWRNSSKLTLPSSSSSSSSNKSAISYLKKFIYKVICQYIPFKHRILQALSLGRSSCTEFVPLKSISNLSALVII